MSQIIKQKGRWIDSDVRRKRNDDIVLRYKSGVTITELMNMYELSYHTIQEILDFYGVYVKQKRKYIPTDPKEKQELINLVLKRISNGESLYHISLDLGYGHNTIDDFIKRVLGVDVIRKHKDMYKQARRDNIIKMLSQGMSNKEIANKLNLSEQTISNEIHVYLNKL